MKLRRPPLAGFLLLAILSLARPTCAQVFASGGATVNNMGQPIGAALIAVCTADPGSGTPPCGSNLVTTYTDKTLTTECAKITTPQPFYSYGFLWGVGCTNPGRVSTRANYTIYAPSGILYFAQVYGYGFTTYVMPFQTAGGGSAGVTSFSSGNLPPAFTTTVTNPTTTPALAFTWSNWLADGILGNFTGSPAAPTIGAIPACPADGGHALVYPSHTLTCGAITGGGGGGAISEEFLYPLFLTNSPFPTTTTDQTKTLFDQQPLTVLAGPKLPTDPTSSVINDYVCTVGLSSTCQNGAAIPSCSDVGSDRTCTYTLGSPVNPGDTIYFEGMGVCGLGCVGNTFTISDTNTVGTPDTFTQMVNDDGSGATAPATSYWAHAHGGLTTITFVVHVNGNLWTGVMHVAILRGSVVPDQFAYDGSAVAGAPTFQAVTTVNATDTLIVTLFAYDYDACTFSAGTGYGFIDIGYGLANGRGISIASAAHNVSVTGTYTPTMASPNCPTNLGSAFTTAFTTDVVGGPGPPYFRLIDSQMLNYFGGPNPLILVNTAGTQLATPHTVIGSCTLGTNCSITLSDAAVFTSSTSYVCTAQDHTAAAATKIVQSSGSAFTITGTGTDALAFSCTGN